MKQHALRIVAVGGAILSLLVSTTCPQISAQTASPGTSTPTPSPTTTLNPEPLSLDCSTAGLSGVSYLATPAPKPTPIPIPPYISRYLAHVLRGRLETCSRTFAVTSSVRSSRACVPESHNIRLLWQQLTFCESLVGGSPTTPSTEVPILWGSQVTPTKPARGEQRYIFVIGVGPDEPMRDKLVASLAENFADYSLVNDDKLIAEPSWSPATFVAQCAEDTANTDGALIAGITAEGSGSNDETIRRRSWMEVDGYVLYAQCVQKPHSQGRTEYVWASNVREGEGHKITLTIFPVLALLLTLGSTYEIFAPARTSSTSSLRVFPIRSPIPPTGMISQVTAGSQTTTNASSIGNLATGFVSGSLAYTSTVTSVPTVDEQTWDTLDQLAAYLIGELNCDSGLNAPLTVQRAAGKRYPLPTPNPRLPTSPVCGPSGVGPGK